MKQLREYSKPFMVKEKFAPNEYVAICAMPSQYLYADMVRAQGGGYQSGSDGFFQSSSHIDNTLARILLWILSLFTGNTYETDGEFTGIRTTSNPSQKGSVFTLNAFANYPIYGSESEMSDGERYNGIDLRGSLKYNKDTEEYYVQGNIS